MTEEGLPVTIKPGTTFTFGPEGILILKGPLNSIGTEDSLISFIGDDDTADQLILKLDWGSEIFNINHAVISNGLVRSLASENLIQNVKFVNTKQLAWNSALIRLWFGRMTIEDCELYGNNRGEGILAHNMTETVVRRCLFEKVPDGVEYINSDNGFISDNIFIDNSDDGIDLNSCVGTTISNNEFYGVHDRGLELGSEKFGSSENLIVHNNLFVDCSVGISLKESSTATITNTTFYSNGIAIDVQTPADSSRISELSVSQSIFIQEPTQLRTNARSIATVTNCLSDQIAPVGDNNVAGSVTFEMNTDRQVTITSDSYPVGFDVSTMGYQQ